MRSFEDSLQRLGINRVDVLLIHDLDPWDHNPATLNAYFTQLKTSGWKALAELREAGVIGGIGAGFNSMGSIPRFLDLFDMDFFLLAMRYTLLEQDVLESEFPRCEERGVGIIIGGGYNSGILATGAVPGAMYNYAPAGPEILERVKKIEAVCARHVFRFPPRRCSFRSAIPSSPRSFPARSRARRSNGTWPPSAIPSPPTYGLSSRARSSFGPTRPRQPKPFWRAGFHRLATFPIVAGRQSDIASLEARQQRDESIRGDDVSLRAG